MFEMGLHDPFRHLKHKLWSKEGLGVKLTTGLPTIKSQESTQFPCVKVTCHLPLKSSWQGLQLCFRPHFNRRSIEKVMGPKVAGVPSLRISGLPLGSPMTKSHLNVAPVERCKVYYKGEGGGFPQVRAMVSLVSLSCPRLVLTPKVLQLCTNYLVLVLCRSVWVSEACQFFLVPSRSFNTPFYPSKMLRAKERASTLCSYVVLCLGFTFGSLRELGAHHLTPKSRTRTW
jgi:hypothetical protein